MELSVIFSELEMIVAAFEYHTVYSKWISRMFTQQQKEPHIQVCEELLNKYEAESSSFLDHIISSDKMCCHHHDPESKQQSVEWQYVIIHQRSSRCSSQWVKQFLLFFGIGKEQSWISWSLDRPQTLTATLQH